jgi:group I intron endonuclease
MKLDKILKVCGIYSIVNKINGFEYIGSSKIVYKRIGYHFSALRGNRHTNVHLQHAFNKYGEEAFEIKLLEICTLDNLKNREEFYILNTPNRYNFIDKPTGPLRLPTPTEEHRKKISIANKGKKRTEEQRKRFSESHKGLKQSEESKQKRSVALKEFYSVEENKHFPTKESLAKSRETFLENHPDGRRLDWITKICLQCNKEFELQPHLAKRVQYCSNECRINAMIGKELTQEHKNSLSKAGKTFYSTDEGKQYIEKLKETQKGPRIAREVRICACGCSGTFEAKVTSKQRYIFTHFKIKKQSEESKRKRSEAMKHFFETPRGLENKENLKVSGLAGKLKQMAMKQKVKSNAN